MCARYFGFLLLIWFPGELHAQREAPSCPAPALADGYIVPRQETYPHDSTLYYACDAGHKPAAEGWWATSTCQNGTWSPVPQCIDENACIPPTIPNAKYRGGSDSWFAAGHILWATCDEGYEHKNSRATTKCTDGTWSPLPVCERKSRSCSEPPKLPHAVIIKQGYQDLFPQDAEVQYECEKGYVIEGSGKDSIICLSGAWTEGPTCSRRADPGRGSSAEVGTGPGPQPGDRGSRPDPGPGSSAEVGTATASRPDPGRGSSATGGTGGGHTTPAIQPGGGGGRGSSTTSDSGPLLAPVETCRSYPVVPHGDVVQKERMHIKYKCNAFYTQVGPDTVMCYSDGTWSQLPVCKDDFCVMTPGVYDRGLEITANQYMTDGETNHLQCKWDNYYMVVRCRNKMITHTRCCHSDDHYWGHCR